MLWKRTVVLLVCLASIFLFLGRQPWRKDMFRWKEKAKITISAEQSPPFEEGEAKEPLPLLNLNDLRSVTYLSVQDYGENETVELRKEAAGWVMQSPIHFPALDLTINRWIRTLEAAKRNGSFPVGPDTDLSEFGLLKPSLRVCLAVDEAGGHKCLLFGLSSPLTKAFYGRLEDEEEIFLLDSAVLQVFRNETVYGLLRKQFFPHVLQMSRAISVRHSGREITVEKREGVWNLTRSEIAPIDDVSIRTLLLALTNLYVREFLGDANWKNPTFQLADEESDFISVSFEDGRREVLHVGAEIAARFSYYGRFSDWSQVFSVSKQKADDLFLLAESLAQANSAGS